VDRDADLTTKTRERFVDRVVDDLVDEVMQAIRTSGPDVHRGSFAYRFEAFEDLD
jgi:hypothetical protein